MRTATLALVLLSLGITLGIGYAVKASCAGEYWSNGFCYSDIPPLYRGEGMDTERLPYLDPCPMSDELCDEYPVVQMWLLRVGGTMSSSISGFFTANAVMLIVAAIVAALGLSVLVGRRALYFSAAPALIMHGFLNWDLVPVAMSVVALVLFARRRDGLAGMFVGLGVATKFFPGLLLLPLVADRLRSGERRRAGVLTAAAAATWTALNAPFVIAAFERWSTFFTFNAARPPEWSTFWYIACSPARILCLRIPTINALSAALFVASLAFVWWSRQRLDPDFARWTLAFPSVALFLITTKVYSPQYSLWLLPFFALAFPRLTNFVVFSGMDVIVSVCYFTWWTTADLAADSPWRIAFQLAALGRTAILIACVVAWARGRVEDEPDRAPAPLPSTA